MHGPGLPILFATLFTFATILPRLPAQQGAVQNAKPAKATDVSELLSCIPKDLQSGLRSNSDDAILKAQTILNDKIRKKQMVLEFRFFSMEKRFESGGDKIQRIQLRTMVEKTRANGTAFSYALTVFLPASAVDQASKLQRNQRVRVSGSIAGASINKGSNGPLVIFGIEGNLE